MNRTPVSSSNLAAIGYDADQHILEVEFVNGSVYQYSNVPIHIYQGLMNADSHGIYFNAYVKKAGYSYQEIR